MPAIEILGLEKTYLVGFWRTRPKCALHPLHLQVEDGEIFGFLGPNGAGTVSYTHLDVYKRQSVSSASRRPKTVLRLWPDRNSRAGGRDLVMGCISVAVAFVAVAFKDKDSTFGSSKDDYMQEPRSGPGTGAH